MSGGESANNLSKLLSLIVWSENLGHLHWSEGHALEGQKTWCLQHLSDSFFPTDNESESLFTKLAEPHNTLWREYKSSLLLRLKELKWWRCEAGVVMLHGARILKCQEALLASNPSGKFLNHETCNLMNISLNRYQISIIHFLISTVLSPIYNVQAGNQAGPGAHSYLQCILWQPLGILTGLLNQELQNIVMLLPLFCHDLPSAVLVENCASSSWVGKLMTWFPLQDQGS